MILGIDSTTDRLHLALHGPKGTWTRSEGGLAGRTRSHSHILLPALHEMFKEAGLDPSALSGVVACVGPGGFTSLRIGVATAEGLALSGIPTWGFSAFELRHRALQLAGHAGPFWILLDGQRGESFAQRWEGHQASPALKLPLTQLPQHVAEEAWWSPRSFAPKVQEYLKHSPLELADEEEATLQALLTICREPKGEMESPLRPYYLRATDAEQVFPEAAKALPQSLRLGEAR